MWNVPYAGLKLLVFPQEMFLVGFIIWLFCFVEMIVLLFLVKSKQQQNIKETRQLYLNKQFISHIQSCHIIFS